MKASNTFAARRQRGMSLVELMVALAIGTFLLAGAISVFAKTRDLYRTNDEAARLQETARYAMSTIEADLRMANYWGLMSRADLIENGPSLDLANPPDVDPTYTLPAELSGYAATIDQCRVGVPGGVPRPGVAHELTKRRALLIRPFAEHGVGDVAGVQVVQHLQVARREGAPLTLILERSVIVPHVEVADEHPAALKHVH